MITNYAPPYDTRRAEPLDKARLQLLLGEDYAVRHGWKRGDLIVRRPAHREKVFPGEILDRLLRFARANGYRELVQRTTTQGYEVLLRR
jgi:hypothetical protein